MIPRIALAGLLLLAAGSGCATGDREARRAEGPPDLLLVTVDTFRADRAGCYGHPGGLTPWMDRVLRNGMLARDAYVPAPLTAVSHASILTGLEPPSHGVRENGSFTLPETVPTLATILRERGFRTAAFIAAFPLESRFGFAQGFDHFDETLGPAGTSVSYYAERPAAEVVDSTLSWIDGIPSGDRWFVWAHFFDPHHPRDVIRSLRKLPGNDYDREIRGMDVEIGRLVKELTLWGGGRAPILAVVSDHGEAFGQHGESSHGVLIHEEVMRSVFGIDAPSGTEEGARLPRGIETRIVRHSDLAPTLLELLGLETETAFEGVSRVGESEDPGAYGESYYSTLHYAWSPLLSWRTGRWAYIEGPNPELYDRIEDPGESRNVLPEHPEVVEDLSGRIAELARDPAPADDTLDPETRAKLQALGYVTGGTDRPVNGGKDPKQLVGSIDRLLRGMHLKGTGNPQAALVELQTAYQMDQENASTLFHLADCHRILGNRPTAISYYRKAIELDPRAAEAFGHLAMLELERGRPEEAVALLEEGLRHNPDAFPLLMTRGDVARQLGNPGEADALYRRALEREPRRVEPCAALALLAESLGNAREAREWWSEALSRDPAHPMIPPRIRSGGSER